MLNSQNRSRQSKRLKSIAIGATSIAVALVVALVTIATFYVNDLKTLETLRQENAELSNRPASEQEYMEQIRILTLQLQSVREEGDSQKAQIGQLEAQIAKLEAELALLKGITPTPTTSKTPGTDPTGKKLVALTFDDGPGKYTAQLLDVLKQHNARATFFVVGYNAVKYQPLLARMAAEGHAVGNHSDQHANLTKFGTKEEAFAALAECNALIEKNTGKPCNMMRPPGGNSNAMVSEMSKDHGLAIIRWSVDTEDWKSRDKDKIIETAFDPSSPYRVRDGAIVLMHDIYECTFEAVKEMLVRLENEGYEMVTVPELLEARGSMEAGNVYYSSAPSN